jgi:putative transposase
VRLRLAYLGVTNIFALLQLLPHSDHDKNTEILLLRHELSVQQRQLGDQRIRFQPADRALLAALRLRRWLRAGGVDDPHARLDAALSAV